MSASFENDLNSFDASVRRAALARAAAALASGEVTRPPVREIMNNHAHTFYSYCSLGLSPYGLVWEAMKQGLAVIGSTDFDVLDALPEMYGAGKALGVKVTVSLESRTFVRGYADREINSPGEPGVLYAMGVGFVHPPKEGTEAGALFASLRTQSRSRNIEMVAKVNAVMGPAAIDYDRDVIPLTPSGNATERHLCAAYDTKARLAFPKRDDLAAFWAKTLSVAPEQAAAMLDDAMSWGARIVNIIPERNWNIKDPAAKAKKLANLAAFMAAARKRKLHVLTGTELNGPGQKFVDSFDAPELAPYVDDFRAAAYFLVNHSTTL